MDIISAIILGLIQGLTEFLPVSSSGHILIGSAILNNPIEEGLLFTIVVHFATALSTIVIFRKDISKIFMDLIKFKWNDSFNFSLFVVISMIPAGLVGFLLNDEIKSIESADQTGLIITGIGLFFTAALLIFSEKSHNPKGIINYFKSFIIGIAQAIAILPGVSRSGSTIATSLLLGINRKKAARFSFLMVIPVIFGAMLKDVLDYTEGGSTISSDSFLPLILGFITAFVTGLFACKWMIKLVRRAKLSYFAYYCLAMGVFAIAFSFSL